VSYDLAVYVARDIDGSELAQIAGAIPDLAVKHADQATLSLTVVRGARRRPCFTVDGPFRVDTATSGPGERGIPEVVLPDALT